MKKLALALFAAAALTSLSGCVTVEQSGPSRQITEASSSKAVTDPRDDSESALRLARLLVEQGRPQAAIGVYAQLDLRKSLSAMELLEFANVASVTEPPKNTLRLFERTEAAVKKEGTELTDAQTAGLYTGLGRAQLAHGNFRAARQSLSKATAADPRNAAAWNALGVLSSAEGKTDEARTAFDKALAIDPENVQFLSNLGLLELSAGNAAKAVEELEAAAEGASREPSVRLNLAFARFMKGDRRGAQKTLTEFLTDEQAKELMSLFGRMKQRVDAGRSTMSEALFAASGRLIELRQRSGDDPDPVPLINLTPDGKPIVPGVIIESEE